MQTKGIPMGSNSRTMEKIVFWIVAIPVILIIGMIFPGVAHATLAGLTLALYYKTFH